MMTLIEKERIKTWFITGSSSGIGYELCHQLSQQGFNVIAASRKVPDFNDDNILCLSADVRDPKSIKNAVELGISKFGRIDVLVNNAGISSSMTIDRKSVV